MKKSRNHRNNKKTITKNRRNKKEKERKDLYIVPSTTPLKIRKISNRIAEHLSQDGAEGLFNPSYAPTINQQLVTLKSIPREELLDCNTESAFEVKTPLQIGIPQTQNGSQIKCFNYTTPQAKQFLLHNLAADKHIDPKKIIPPIQSQSNCWFNAMFVSFFVSDKGRKFFHFLRQLMIEGKQKNGTVIPSKLRDVFALLNFGIDACLTGNKFAYTLDTNRIIHRLYKHIPQSYKSQYPYIVDVDEAGNPLLYYISIINYLNDNSIVLLLVRDADNNWKDKVVNALNKMTHLPHIIVLEVYDPKADQFNKKPISFTVNKGKYQIDSAIVRDTTKQHFCSTITCEKQEMGYDGMSFHRLVPLEWKQKMNSNFNWEFEGTKDFDGTPLVWNFTKCYQMLMYYRIE
jgi:hypothetical protein